MSNESGRVSLEGSRFAAADPLFVLAVSGRGNFEERSSFAVPASRRPHRIGR